jgi:ABC-type phosphate transport system auxiliary subunit
MMIEDPKYLTALLEDLAHSVKVLAEGHIALNHRLDELKTWFDRLDAKVDKLEVFAVDTQLRLGKLETKVDGLETKVEGLAVFARDAQGRLKRIETHLALKQPARPGVQHKALRRAAPERRKKS